MGYQLTHSAQDYTPHRSSSSFETRTDNLLNHVCAPHHVKQLSSLLDSNFYIYIFFTWN